MTIIGERIRLLRKEKNWSQTELAKKINSDARQISLYENGKITPSPEIIVKIAQVFEVTTDYLLIEKSPKKPFILDDKVLSDYLEDIQNLQEEDRRCLFHMIDSFKTKNKIKSFAQGLN
ncbi:MAG: helix-turn-helix domain-containing protein [Candidatus Aminicenantes bacterium]|nr:helix-turn-helix domain-containing protein [Candidatus Aminicenantes bacterium]NIN22561.1 helix-turn-helix domain-containing protein [Candidatus Aminicenantes bacterium]NIN46330.1 helix-turn-helix domain-containing protein [Candidatus Aminicenantes bacterium]NIN89171.1 helix-turn-helix domain-containing protein [Candidatus Aminicenantes bacterium]NIO85659.1 helix-turn-helix domain-containing protein [Candidatus Aminicenantes bacterium]